MLESQLGYFGQKLTVTDRALRQEGRLGIEVIMNDGSGRESRTSRFLPYAEARMQNELYTSIEHQLLIGKKSTKPGPQGYVKRSGSGIREQLKDGLIKFGPFYARA